MPAFVEPDVLSEDIANKIHDFNSDAFSWVLTNSAPNVATTELLGNVTQISTGNGYTQLTDGNAATQGMPTTVSFSRSGQTTTIATTQAVLTATGAIGPFSHIVLINDTPTSAGGTTSPGANPVIGWVALSSSITMANTDTFTIPASNILTIN